ncbi:trans-1,2-dihydrobenzene-1,2-diol dehydrogenase-like isoform X2 [Pollicipes pollicipes]|uniref:trans-1,2-dihydrobenzene-1,2-diol dehydrogenase-like isoform X2 n=1 Tax=Pollicipes pollicipes TaxID=41117 RepID=UPI001885631B|nr:trans-1,2-dihydrobenzene-1,2-diol dehydrogenase-like isoform X2 [Pollicipes pollicipes]
MTSLIRWGIIGCGNISHDFVTAVRSLKAEENQTVVAVAARSLENAKKFAGKHQVPKAYGSYAEIMDDPDIDVYYVGTVQPTHFDVVSQLLKARRPVLCEKPLCMTVRQTQELVNLSYEKETFLMEAVWTRCFPAVRRLVQELEDGIIGDVLHVSATFGIATEPDSRLRKMSLGGGSALDLGIYCAQLVNLVMANQRWSQLRTLGHLNSDGCDLSLSTSVTYPNRQLATLVTHCEVQLHNEAVISGTKGIIKLAPPFHCPTELELPSGSVSFPLPDSLPDATYMYANSAGLQYEALHAADCLRKGDAAVAPSVFRARRPVTALRPLPQVSSSHH